MYEFYVIQNNDKTKNNSINLKLWFNSFVLKLNLCQKIQY